MYRKPILTWVYDVNKDKEKTIYGVPFATNAAGVIYNTEKFEELGLEVPKTWDEFIDLLQKIQDAGERHYCELTKMHGQQMHHGIQ